MPNPREFKAWVEKARPVLDMVQGQTAEARDKEIAVLLETMRHISDADPDHDYQVLRSQERHKQFTDQLAAYETEFDDHTRAAAAAAGAEEKKTANRELANLRLKVRIELGKARPTKSPRVRRQMLEAARHEPVYRDQRREMEAALKQISSLPGAEVKVKFLQNLLDNAEKLEPDYNNALKEIQAFYIDRGRGQWGLGLKATVEEARELSRNLPKNLFKGKLAKEFKSAEDKLEDYSQKAQVADAAGIEDFRERIQKLLKDSVDGHKKEDSAREALEKIIEELDEGIGKCDSGRQWVLEKRQVLEEKWESFETTAPVSMVILLKAQKEKAEALESCQLYEEATKAYDAVIGKIDTDTKIWLMGPVKWNEAQRQVARMEKAVRDADELRKTKRLRELEPVATKLRDEILRARKEVELRKDYYLACQIIQAKENETEELIEAVQTLGSGGDLTAVPFADGNRSMEVKLEALSRKVHAQLRKVKEGPIARLGEAKGEIGPLQQECRAIEKGLLDFVLDTRARFKKSYQRAGEDQNNAHAEQKEVLERYLKKVEQKWGALEAKVSKVSKQATDTLDAAELLQSSKWAANIGRIDEEARKVAGEVEDLLTELEAFQLPDGHLSLAVITRVRKDLPNPASQATAALKPAIDGFKKELEEEKRKVDDEIARRVREAAEKSKELNGKIDRFGKHDKKYREFFATLRMEVAVAASQKSSKVYAISEKGEQSLDRIEAKLEEGEKILKDEDRNYEEVENQLKSFTESIETFKALDPPGYARLTHSLGQVTQEVHKLGPGQARKRLEVFEKTELKPALDRAGNVRTKLAEFQKKLGDFDGDLTASGLAKKGQALYRSLEAARAAAVAETPHNVVVAMNGLAAARLLLESAADPEDCDRLNVNAEEDEFTTERRRNEYDAASELFKRTYQKRAIEASTRRKDEREAMDRMADHADRMAHRTPPDLAAARQSLDRAIDMAKFIIDNAKDGTSPTDRNLKRLNQSWKNRVSTYLKELTALTKAIAEAESPDQYPRHADVVGAKKALDPLLSLFDPRAFDRYIEELGKSKEINQRRKTKEAALLRVRRFQNKLQNNVLLKHVDRNPISKVDLKPLRDTLAGLDRELLGS